MNDLHCSKADGDDLPDQAGDELRGGGAVRVVIDAFEIFNTYNLQLLAHSYIKPDGSI